jgi:hypothetical protein
MTIPQVWYIVEKYSPKAKVWLQEGPLHITREGACMYYDLEVEDFDKDHDDYRISYILKYEVEALKRDS